MAEKPSAEKPDGDPKDLIRVMPAKGDRPADHFRGAPNNPETGATSRNRQTRMVIIMRGFIRWALTATGVAALGFGIAIPAATASATAAPACTTTVNWIGLPGNGHAGGLQVQLEFSNTGRVTCTLHGHPGVTQMYHGKQVGLPARWGGTPATVTLKPGATAHAVLNVTDAGILCSRPRPSDSLSVIAPGLKTAWPDPFQSTACPGKSVMLVGPVRAGVGVPFYTIS
jgi:hypothetical protein